MGETLIEVLNLYATRLDRDVGFMIKEELANKRLEKRINTSKLKQCFQSPSNHQIHKDQNLPTIYPGFF